jgi:putative membrane protein
MRHLDLVTGHAGGGWAWVPPLVLAAVAVAAAYAHGLAALRRRGGAAPAAWRAWSFGVGLLAAVAVLLPPVDGLADRLLSAHMAQHLVLILVAAPLMVLGRPGLPVLLALPARARRRAVRWRRARWARAAWRALTLPMVAWLVHVSVLWAWHAPGPYQAALRSDGLHALEHATFLGTALLFWHVALATAPHRRIGRGADVAYVLAGWVQSGALGALFTFASTPLYPAYVRRAGDLAAALRDQQIAGVVMWIPAGIVYLAAAAALFVAWLRAVERESDRLDGLAPALRSGW